MTVSRLLSSLSSMKTIFLLRHAQTHPPSYTFSDRERVLTNAGQAQARTLGEFLQKNNYYPNAVLCSPAVRTRQTLEGICEHVEGLRVEYPEKLYGASLNDHMSILQNLNKNFDSIMIIAHNPGIFELALRLANEEGRDRIGVSYAPGTLTVLSHKNGWADLPSGSSRVIDLFKPVAD